MFTPSRRVGGKRVVCYDDRFIVKLANDLDGIIVSNDTYRDLQIERPDWKRCIEEGLLMYSFVNDKYVIKSLKKVCFSPISYYTEISVYFLFLINVLKLCAKYCFYILVLFGFIIIGIISCFF